MHYIKDETLRNATKIAYQKMLETKDFDSTVKHYAEKYGLDFDDLAHEVKKMQRDANKKTYKRRKKVREEYKPEIVNVSTAAKYKEIIKGLKKVGKEAQEQGNVELADLMCKTIVAISEMTKAIGLSR